MKECFKYFRVLFIIFGILFVVTAVAFLPKLFANGTEGERANYECPTERVYDYANVLTDSEEEKLREQIARVEKKVSCDIVLVTINLSVLDYYGYTENTDYYWEDAMMRYADDFYDECGYGYDKVCGDGVLLLDNWYMQGMDESEAGSWLSTCGAVYERYSTSMIDRLLDNVYYALDDSPYKAYSVYIDNIEYYMDDDENTNPLISLGACFMVALIPSLIFVFTHLKAKEGKKTVTRDTYVDALNGGNAVFKVKTDELIDKRVTSVRIQTSSSSGSSRSRSSGGGGSHRSSSGTRHGGGGRRR